MGMTDQDIIINKQYFNIFEVYFYPMNSRNERLLHILGSIFIICGFLAYYYSGSKSISLLISSIGGGAIAWTIAYFQKNNKLTAWYGFGFLFLSSIRI
jgi:hypothetical protein